VALAAVLEAHGRPAGAPRVADLRRRRRWRDAAGLITHLSAAAAAGPSFVALHMTWGAVNEWTTQAAYARLGTLEDHPTLRELLSRIMRQEGRHIDFYSSEAARRLAGGRGVQRLVRTALDRLWRPVGSGVMAPAEVAFMARHLFSGVGGRDVTERIDRQVDRLPGLAGLHLLRRAADRAAGPAPVQLRPANRSPSTAAA
jgi:hypothetical protein